MHDSPHHHHRVVKRQDPVSVPGVDGGGGGGGGRPTRSAGGGNGGGGGPAISTPEPSPTRQDPQPTPSTTTQPTPDRSTTPAPSPTQQANVVTTFSTAQQSTITVQPSTTRPTTSSVAPTTISLSSRSLSSFSLASSSSISGLPLAATSAPAEESGTAPGLVVGAVAGALVGLVVLAGLIGYFMRTKFGRKEEDDVINDPFSRDEFRRESVMLPDSHSEDGMSQIGGGALGRKATAAGNPRPPSFIERHYAGQQYQGGPGAYGAYSAQPAWNPYGPSGAAPGQFLGAYGQGDLHRQATTASATSRYAPEPPMLDDAAPQSRSGTPTNANPQMAYHHNGEDSFSSSGDLAAAAHARREQTNLVDRVDRAQRTLSVRNGGLDEYHAGARASVALSDAYGGTD